MQIETPEERRQRKQILDCAACREERLHTDDEWKDHHPWKGHGYTKETGHTKK